jgi:hypothetical protein
MTMLGPHVIRPTDAALAFASHAPIVKGLDTVAPFLVAPDSAIRCFRHYFPTQTFGPGAGVAAAMAIISALGTYRHPNLFVELLNEIGQEVGDGLEAHADFTREALPVLTGAGLRVAAFSFGVGHPRIDGWRYLRDRGFCGLRLDQDAIAIHEYTPDMTIDGWHLMRCAQVPNWVGGVFPKLIVTECGYDNAGTNAGGWLANGIGRDDYVRLLATYDVSLSKLGYVLGAALFTSGASSDWSNFDTDALDLSRFWTQTGGNTNMDEQTQDAAIATEKQQNTYLTEALKRIRQGKWTGADGVDGLIVALQGGAPLDFTPSFP